MASQAQPPAHTPIVQNEHGNVSVAWLLFFSSLVAAPGVVAAQTVTGSPFSFTASVPGKLLVQGGTVSLITLKRGRVTTTTGVTSGFIPVGRADVVAITYSVLPVVTFIPD